MLRSKANNKNRRTNTYKCLNKSLQKKYNLLNLGES